MNGTRVRKPLGAGVETSRIAVLIPAKTWDQWKPDLPEPGLRTPLWVVGGSEPRTHPKWLSVHNLKEKEGIEGLPTETVWVLVVGEGDRPLRPGWLRRVTTTPPPGMVISAGWWGSPLTPSLSYYVNRKQVLKLGEGLEEGDRFPDRVAQQLVLMGETSKMHLNSAIGKDYGVYRREGELLTQLPTPAEMVREIMAC